MTGSLPRGIYPDTTMHLTGLSLYNFKRFTKMANNEKKETTPLTWIVTLVVMGLVFVVTKNAFEGKPYLLFESAESKRIRITEECKQEAYDRARSLRDTNLRVLKAKKNPTPQDLIQIEDLENHLAEGLVSRDDYDRYFEECMDMYGYD